MCKLRLSENLHKPNFWSPSKMSVCCNVHYLCLAVERRQCTCKTQYKNWHKTDQWPATAAASIPLNHSHRVITFYIVSHHTFTWLSVMPKLMASCFLSAAPRYFCFSNRFSREKIWAPENVGLIWRLPSGGVEKLLAEGELTFGGMVDCIPKKELELMP